MPDVTPKQLEVLKALTTPHSWNPTTADVARWAGCSLAAARGRLASLVSPDLYWTWTHDRRTEMDVTEPTKGTET